MSGVVSSRPPGRRPGASSSSPCRSRHRQHAPPLRTLSPVHDILERSARHEPRCGRGPYLKVLASARTAPDTGRPAPRRERAETHDSDVLAALKLLADRREHGAHRRFGGELRHRRLDGNPIHDIGLLQSVAPQTFGRRQHRPVISVSLSLHRTFPWHWRRPDRRLIHNGLTGEAPCPANPGSFQPQSSHNELEYSAPKDGEREVVPAQKSTESHRIL